MTHKPPRKPNSRTRLRLRIAARGKHETGIRGRYDVCMACGDVFDMKDIAETVRHRDPAHYSVIARQ